MKKYLILGLLSIPHLMSAMEAEIKIISLAEAKGASPLNTTQENYTNPALPLERQKRIQAAEETLAKHESEFKPEQCDSETLAEDIAQHLKTVLAKSRNTDISEEDKIQLLQAEVFIALLKAIAYGGSKEKFDVAQMIMEKANNWLQNTNCSPEALLISLSLKKVALHLSSLPLAPQKPHKLIVEASSTDKTDQKVAISYNPDDLSGPCMIG